MSLTSFEETRRENKMRDTDLETMIDSQGCLLSELSTSFDQEVQDCSLKSYLLACMLLAENRDFFKNMEEKLSENDLRSMPSLSLTRLQRKRPRLMTQSGSNCNGQQSNECLIPGLNGDIALDCLARASISDYSSLIYVNKRFNLLIKSGYLSKLRRELGIVEYWVFLACSLMPWAAFDPVRRRWMLLPTMPCDECFSYADKESLAVGTQLLVFGRELTGFAIWKYNLVGPGWSRCSLMSIPRCLFGSSSSGEIAIVAGGSDRTGCVLKCAELYNSDLGTWESLPDMHMPRKMCSGFFMDGHFYVIGGMCSHTESLTCGEEFNLETRTWKRILDMYPGGNRATQSPPLVAVVNNQLYAADQSANVVKKYDKANNSWSIIRRLPVRADSYNGWGLAFKACGDKLLVIGGHRGPQGEVVLLHFWRPEEGSVDGTDWDVLSIRERAGAFVYNCAIMGC